MLEMHADLFAKVPPLLLLLLLSLLRSLQASFWLGTNCTHTQQTALLLPVFGIPPDCQLVKFSAAELNFGYCLSHSPVLCRSQSAQGVSESLQHYILPV